MREVIEHYGSSVLGMITVLAVLEIALSLLGRGGLLSNIVADFMSYLSG